MPVITIKNISKKYKINTAQNSYINIQDKLARLARHPFTVFQGCKGDVFWALKDINLEINRGDILGIIGPNGAGKSTLLKILAKVTPPTNGSIMLKGRVASLLEVGTGFNPELSGRENIYLYGSIIGMKKKEIDDCYDQIVGFAEVGNFIDTPVKRYSSGMRVRLAFAVSAYISADIILIDEVLSVGDIGFRKKCYEKILEITGRSEKTVVIVGHDMNTIRSLCSKCILLEKGEVAMQGDAESVVDNYIRKIENLHRDGFDKAYERRGENNVWFRDVKIKNSKDSQRIKSGDRLKIIINYASNYSHTIKNTRFSLGIFDKNGAHLLRFDNTLTREAIFDIPNNGEIVCETEELNLEKGRYFVNVGIFVNGVMQDQIRSALVLEIGENYPFYGFVDYKKYNYVTSKENIPFLIRHKFYKR